MIYVILPEIKTMFEWLLKTPCGFPVFSIKANPGNKIGPQIRLINATDILGGILIKLTDHSFRIQ